MEDYERTVANTGKIMEIIQLILQYINYKGDSIESSPQFWDSPRRSDL